MREENWKEVGARGKEDGGREKRRKIRKQWKGRKNIILVHFWDLSSNCCNFHNLRAETLPSAPPRSALHPHHFQKSVCLGAPFSWPLPLPIASLSGKGNGHTRQSPEILNQFLLNLWESHAWERIDGWDTWGQGCQFIEPLALGFGSHMIPGS